MTGARLGPYEIGAKLGEGGMGEVDRATDTKPKREVAIKVLPAAFTEDGERLARFEREAQLLAQLHHPNIASIFGLEESEGVRALSGMAGRLPDSRRLVLASVDGVVIYDTASGTTRPILAGHQDSGLSLARNGEVLMVEDEVLDSDIWLLDFE